MVTKKFLLLGLIGLFTSALGMQALLQPAKPGVAFRAKAVTEYPCNTHALYMGSKVWKEAFATINAFKQTVKQFDGSPKSIRAVKQEFSTITQNYPKTMYQAILLLARVLPFDASTQNIKGNEEQLLASCNNFFATLPHRAQLIEAAKEIQGQLSDVINTRIGIYNYLLIRATDNTIELDKLIDEGYNLNAEVFYDIVLLKKALQSNKDIVPLLIEKGANPNVNTVMEELQYVKDNQLLPTTNFLHQMKKSPAFKRYHSFVGRWERNEVLLKEDGPTILAAIGATTALGVALYQVLKRFR